jgi:hypothetical protein
MVRASFILRACLCFSCNWKGFSSSKKAARFLSVSYRVYPPHLSAFVFSSAENRQRSRRALFRRKRRMGTAVLNKRNWDEQQPEKTLHDRPICKSTQEQSSKSKSTWQWTRSKCRSHCPRLLLWFCPMFAHYHSAIESWSYHLITSSWIFFL